MKFSYPVIVVPGITASALTDVYPIPAEDVWQVVGRSYDRIALHPNNLSYEAQEPARVVPGQPFRIPYEELIEELRYNLRPRADEPVPVYGFGYDWRMPLEVVEEQLGEFITEVIERTALLKHYHKAGYAEDPKVNLVGHSMGGLVITGYLEKAGNRARVNKVVTIATPYRGSFEVIAKITTGNAELGLSTSSSREREAARLTPALYYLIPDFKRGLNIAEGLPGNLFDIRLWQPSIIQSIAEIIRLNGLSTRQRQQDARKLLAGLLTDAKTHRKRIVRFKLSQASLEASDWLAVVGMNTRTRVGLSVVKRSGKPFFRLGTNDRRDEWESGNNLHRRFSGDGTVPFEGAVPPFLGEENLVCVTPGDFGYWEVGDRALSATSGFHGILPKMNMLHRLIVRFFSDRPDSHGNTWGKRAPGVSHWQPPLDLAERE